MTFGRLPAEMFTFGRGVDFRLRVDFLVCAHSEHFGCSDLAGGELENSWGAGASSHWEARVRSKVDEFVPQTWDVNPSIDGKVGQQPLGSSGTFPS